MSLHTVSTERVLSSFVRQHLHAGPARLARRQFALGRAPARAQAVRLFSPHHPSNQTCRTTPLLPCMRAAVRPFSSTSQTADSAHPSTSFPDPERPDLFYHLFEPPTDLSHTSPVFALSFLPTPPPSVRSCTVIGWLPASTPGAQEEGAGLNDFVENRAYACFESAIYAHPPRLALPSVVSERAARSNPERVARRCRRDPEERGHPNSSRLDAHPRCVSR